MKYNITDVTERYTESTTVMPDGFGAWMAVNTGNVVSSVMGYELQPGEGLDFKDAVPAGSTWGKPIQIKVGAGGSVRITKLYANEKEPEKVVVA